MHFCHLLELNAHRATVGPGLPSKLTRISSFNGDAEEKVQSVVSGQVVKCIGVVD